MKKKPFSYPEACTGGQTFKDSTRNEIFRFSAAEGLAASTRLWVGEWKKPYQQTTFLVNYFL
jgi:hypothetical protein